MTVDLVAIQLEIGEAVLASPDAYRRAIDDAAAGAVQPGADHRLIVFPEDAGHLALYALAPAASRRQKTLAGALGAAAIRRPLDVLRGVAVAHTLDPRHAAMAALAPDADKFWRGTFGPLARRHAAYVVAGSHLRLAPGGALTNASMLFDPDGRLVATTDKVNLIVGVEDGAPGGLGLARGNSARLPFADAPFGKLCTLIGYDASAVPDTALERFDPVVEHVAARGGVDVIANPCANPQPRAARAGLPATLAAAALARLGVTAHLVGRILDLEWAGASEIVVRDADGVRALARAADPTRGGHVTARV